MFHIPNYNIGKKIYEGKTIIIFKGIRLNDSIPVLLKFLHAEHPDLHDIAKLNTEYKLSEVINSDNIVKIHGRESNGKTPVLVLEDFGGESLRKILNIYKKFNLMDFLKIAIKLSTALFDINNINIIHKDINPDNIIINMKNGIVKLTDFGSASLFSIENNNTDIMNKLEGLLDYISPEQTGRINHIIDYRTDFYSLGVLFYEMLTGFLPFPSKDELGIIHCHLAVTPIPPHEHETDIPEVISDIVLKLMEKMPENRYQSAMGLKHDLQKCMDVLKSNGPIEHFKIGQKDFSDGFHILDKLYGRDQEILVLMSAFERIGKDPKQAIMVTGYSGVGKSELVNKFRNSIKKQHGYFISGKFDQFEHDIPHSALVYSFKDLVDQILTESKERIDEWKKKLLNMLGSNGQVIINVIPEVEMIIGKQPEVVELPAEETKNRFNKVFQDFVRTFCELQNPLVIFLDDLQWADLASLKLIEVLMSDFEIKHMLLIGAYRDNEVNRTHPLVLTLNNIEKENIIVNTIFLKPLELVYIKQLIAETFRCDLEESNSLAELSQQKTEGNPFFLTQFLYSLYKEQLIWLNKEECKWQWDLQRIQNAQITDNVVDLIAARMLKFSKNAVEALKLAACIGSQFDLETLSIICDRTFEDTYYNICDAIKEGMILPTINIHSPIYKSETSIASSYTFLHDRIQQAAYSLIEDEDRKGIHLKIGRLMLPGIDRQKMDGKLLDVVNHLNRGIELVSDSYEKEQIAKLELLAGRMVKKSTAYVTSYNYLRIGIKLIESYGFERCYELTHSLYVEAAELACLNGDFEMLEQYTEIALNNSKTTLDKVKLYEIKIIAYTVQNKKLEVIDTALFVLKLLGVMFPKNPNLFNVLISFLKTKFMLMGSKQDHLLELPEMTDKLLSAVLRVIVKMGMSTYMIAPNLFLLITLKSVRLYIKHGNVDNSAIGYAAYGMLLCYLGDINSGYKFGKLSLQLLDKFDGKEYRAQTIVLVNSFVSFWKESVKSILIKFSNAYLIALETGNINYACTSACLYSIYAYYSGENLVFLKRKMSEYSEVMHKLNNKEALTTLSIYQQSVLNLVDFHDNTCYLKGTVYDEDTMIPIHLKAKDRGTLCNVYLNKSILAYLFGEYDKAVKNSAMAEKYLDGVTGTLTVPVFYFYNSLIILATIGECSSFRKKQLIYKVFANQQKMKKWSTHAEMNFLHKYYLIKAEMARVLKKNLNAMKFYEKSINLASDSEYLQEEALANELAAKFYTNLGNEKIAKTYVDEALYCYTLWGASAKIVHLKKLYPKFSKSYKFARSSIEDITTTYENKPTGNSVALDTATIIKATQAISEEIILEELLKKLVYILLENAGAQRACYLVKKEGRYVIQAEGRIDEKKIEVLKEIDLENNKSLPEKIIYYVEHSKKSVILDDASVSEKYMSDLYIVEKQPKSIMCMPVISKGSILGILYLENSLIEGVFNNERIEIMKVISSQLAISLENATLYTNLEYSQKELKKHHDELEELIEKRTAKLKEEITERKKAEKQLQEIATHDDLTGLPNRKLFYHRLNHSLELAKQNKLLLGIIFIDLDGFKGVNDTLGHASGDIVLKIVAERLFKAVSEAVVVSRFGGDEFVIILGNIENETLANIICHRIIDEVGNTIVLGENNVNVTASIGVAFFPTDGEDTDQLIKKADNAMYMAKESGKNKVIFSN